MATSIELQRKKENTGILGRQLYMAPLTGKASTDTHCFNQRPNRIAPFYRLCKTVIDPAGPLLLKSELITAG